MSKTTTLAVATVEPRQDIAIQSWAELQERANFFAQSDLLPAALKKKPADVAIILQMGWELNIPPMQAINGITVIQGKPTVSPELCIALIYSRLPAATVEYIKTTESLAVVKITRDRSRPTESYTATWDDAKADKMGLLGKDNYKKQKGNMLKWRAVGEAAHAICPDILKGMYLTPEMQDVDPTPGEPSNDKAKKLDALISTATASPVIEATLEAATTQTKAPDAAAAKQGTQDGRIELGQKLNAMKKALEWTNDQMAANVKTAFNTDMKSITVDQMTKMLALMQADLREKNGTDL
jgi:hypothetical protein